MTRTRMRRRSRPPGEFDLIDRLVTGLRLSRRTVLGPGDDCAVLAADNARKLFTIDSMVEGIHFKLGWGRPEQIGARALTVNLSDIAAMGGFPIAAVVNLAVTKACSAKFLGRLYDGLNHEARTASVDIVGGNVTSARQMAITIALLGDSPAHPLRRDLARVDDEIFVTGTLGDAGLGWRILAGRIRASGAIRRHLVARYLSPVARLLAGQRLARLAARVAAIDVSDGLLQDLGHILERSEVGAEIEVDSIPVSKAYNGIMGKNRSLALGGGEDYELLFCLCKGYSEHELSRRLGLPVHRIGTIVRRPGVRLDGKAPHAAIAAGWDQLRVR